MEKLYTNWLTKLLQEIQKEDDHQAEKIKSLLASAELLDLGNRFEPTFFNFSKLDYVKKLQQECEVNYPSIKVTIGILVKNQEDNIESTMASALNFCDNLIIVDTGSTDNTITKIKNYQSSKIKLYEILWTGNFSEMRNKIVELNENKWLFFVDSDEIISSQTSFMMLKNVLNLIDVLLPNRSVCLQIKQWAAQYSSFSFIERIIRKSDKTEYFGLVHEGVRSPTGELNLIHLELSLSNRGLLDEEVTKFDKKEIYKKLTLKMLEEDSENPRWIANMTNPDEKTPAEEILDYFNLLKKGLLIHPERSVTLSNLRESEYLHMIFGKYLLVRLMTKEVEKAISESAVALKKFPMSTFILFIHHYAKYLKAENEKKILFEDLLLDLSAIDTKEAEEISQQKQDMIKSLLVKYMFDFHDYNSAIRLLSEITDIAALQNVTLEKSILQKLLDIKV
ncbi:glycosyltransferase [Lactococcus lactis]|uniref:glycosyltransferase n=1 Tax=Lactococcus lactis TaxID=1358 RepID=UPI002025C90E|nr:glycosyltransferase [Lactococcus lactis]MCL9638857.1 glycosyltransferase family 2 protein [Lactococcus lactis]